MSTSTREPDDLRDVLGAYAIGAVDDVERAEIEQWLATDDEARATAEGLAAAARSLHTSDGPAPAVWTAIETAIASGEHRPAAVVPISAIRPARVASRRVSRVVSVAAAVAAAAVIAVVASTSSEPTLPSAPASAVEQAAKAALATEGAERISLVPTDGIDPVNAVVLPDGRGFVLDATLSRVYRLLAITESGPVLVAILEPDVGTTAFRLPAGTLGLVVARGEEIVASAAVPPGLLPAPTTAPTQAPAPSTTPPGPSLTLPTLPPVLPTLPGGGLDLGALDLSNLLL